MFIRPEKILSEVLSEENSTLLRKMALSERQRV